MNADSDTPDAAETGASLAVAQRMEELRSQYLDNLPRQLQSLQARLDTAGEAVRAVLPELYEGLHAIAGSGGTFGQARLSVQAHHLAMQVRFWMAQPDSDSIDRAGLSAQLALLLQTVASEVPNRSAGT